jgi:2'-5' RNA ligase
MGSNDVLEGVHSSGLIVEIAAAERVVASFRTVLDPVARLGVPPHVTVLFPFVTGVVGAEIIDRIAALCTRFQPFDAVFSSTAWFGDEVLWLAPDDPSPFIGLTESATAEFPGYPPYGGQFEEIVPHLTVADRADHAAMEAAAHSIAEFLPIYGRADGITLMTQTEPGGMWTRARRFAFGSQDVARSSQ